MLNLTIYILIYTNISPSLSNSVAVKRQRFRIAKNVDSIVKMIRRVFVEIIAGVQSHVFRFFILINIFFHIAHFLFNFDLAFENPRQRRICHIACLIWMYFSCEVKGYRPPYPISQDQNIDDIRVQSIYNAVYKPADRHFPNRNDLLVVA